MSEIIKSEPIDVEEFTQKRSKRGRKRKTTDSENELKANYDKESNEYKKKRLRNNIAVRKSRDKGTGSFNFSDITIVNAKYRITRNFHYLAELSIYSKLIPKKQNSVKLSNKTDWWQWQRILTMPEILLIT